MKKLAGLFVGFVNGLLGSGGGMVAVPLLECDGLETKKAHAGSIAVILPLSAVSAAFYLWRGDVSFSAVLPYVPGGLIGSFIGTKVITKIPPVMLKRIFGAFAVWAGVRMVL